MAILSDTGISGYENCQRGKNLKKCLRRLALIDKSHIHRGKPKSSRITKNSSTFGRMLTLV